MKIISGHQPVYLPWIGLFHKASLCDVFVYMDDVQYLSQDWNNRNKIKGPQGSFWLTAPVSLKESNSKILKDIKFVKENWDKKSHWQKAHWRGLQNSYGRAPFWKEYSVHFEEIYMDKPWVYLSDMNEVIFKKFLELFNIKIEVIKASEYNFSGKKSDLVLNHCEKLNGDFCVLGQHGKEYLNIESFKENNIDVYFQEYIHPTYRQHFGEFESHLSAIDLLFNCGPESSEILKMGNIQKNELSANKKKLGRTY